MKRTSVKNLLVRPKLLSLIAAGLLAATTLGCSCGNKQIWDGKNTFNKAIIFGDGTATIIEIQKWNDYDGEQLQLITPDGLIIVTSSFDTKLINDKNSEYKAEDLARSIGGEYIQINYLDKPETYKGK